MKRNLDKNQRGFTLVELMITVGIAGILLGVAVPSFQDLMRNGRISSTSNDFVSSLQLTRSEAVKRGHQVIMCKSANGSSCTTSGDWSAGWLIFADEDNDNALDATETTIQVHEALSTGTTLSGDASTANFISFVENGSTKQPGTLSLSLASKSKSIILSGVGRIKAH